MNITRRKWLVLLVGLLCSSLSSNAQVEFTKFKFGKDSPLGCCPGRKMTQAKFTVTADKAIKYVKVHYYGVNEVGDAVSSDIVGAVNANVEPTKYYILSLMGPYEPGEKYSRWASGTFWYPMKVTAFPHHVELIYMDGEKDMIEVTKDNYKELFPCLKKWIDVNLEDGM